MRKYTAFGLAFLLATSGTSTIALADNVEPNEQTQEEVTESNDGNQQDGAVEGTPIEKQGLTLEEAISHALKANPDLIMLRYQERLLEAQRDSLLYQKDEAEDSLDDLLGMQDDLLNPTLPAPGVPGGTLEPDWSAIEELDKTIQEIQKGIDQIGDPDEMYESQITNLFLTEDQLKEGVKLATTVTFMQLIMTEDQLDLQRKALEIKEKDVETVKLKSTLGILSHDAYEKKRRELVTQKSNFEQTIKKWEKDMAEFALDLKIELAENEVFSLQSPEIAELKLIEQDKETKALIENSFQYKQQLEAIDNVDKRRDDVYDDLSANPFDEELEDVNLKIEKQKLENLERDLEETIRTLYYDIKDGYQAIKDAELDLANAQEDYKLLTTQYELGLVSRIDYESAYVQVQQAELSLELAKQSYFILMKREELFEVGLIQ